jgi:hypothetical protein
MKAKNINRKEGNNMDLDAGQPIGMGDGVMDMVKEQRESEKDRAAKDAKFIESVDSGFSLFSWGWTQPLKRTRSEVDSIFV